MLRKRIVIVVILALLLWVAWPLGAFGVYNYKLELGREDKLINIYKWDSAIDPYSYPFYYVNSHCGGEIQKFLGIFGGNSQSSSNNQSMGCPLGRDYLYLPLFINALLTILILILVTECTLFIQRKIFHPKY